ncbi:MAG TPA: HAD family hydrolase [Candidatus Binatia bacterium]|nr:HAD family hydrolase [Candidatus Binatia bacterium]
MGNCDDSRFCNIEYVFLDRDGVLNRKPPAGGYVTRWEELEILPGVEGAIAELNRSGRRVIVVTNQRGIALGLYSMAELAGMHDRLQAHLARHGAHLDGFYVCPHDSEQCHCRKPETGLFEQAFCDFPAARSDNSLMAGDSLRDIEAGARLGMRTVFIAGDDAASSPEAEQASMLAQITVASLRELVERYLCPKP